MTTIMPQIKPNVETFAKIKVVGIGGSGGSAVERMVQSGIRGVEFIVMNTDVQALHHNSAQHKLHIGKSITRGLGAGMNPDIGKRAAEESQNEIRELLKDADMVFITCGLGGGTGSGASPVIASIAQDLGALTVAVVTKPFDFEGPQRDRIAEKAHQELAAHVDTIITIPNDRVFSVIDKKTPVLDAFARIDEILQQGVKGISELITVPGLINVDFADVKAIMANQGSALMGIGKGTGENRAADAAKAAISSPLLEISIDGARGILFTIAGGKDLGMQEVSDAAKIITSSADDDVKVIFGAVIDETLADELRITVIATGFDREPFTRNIESMMQDEALGRKPGVNVRPFVSGSSFRKPVQSSVSHSPSRRMGAMPIEDERMDDDLDQASDDLSQEDGDTISRGFMKKRTTGYVPAQPAANSSSSFATPNKERVVPQQSRAVPVQQTPAQAAAESEEDIDIPAFLRKKIGL